MKRVWHSELRSYGIAVGMVVLGVLFTAATWSLLEPLPFALLLLAAMVSGWYGGLGPGILATLLALVASAVFLFPPVSALFLPTSEEFPRLEVFTVLALLMSLLTGARYRAARTLRESEARFQQVFDLAAVPALLLAPDGHFLRVNQALCALFGYPEAALLTRTLQDLTYAADLSLTEEHLQRVRSGAQPASPIEQRFVHRQGQCIWGLVSCCLLRDKTGVPLYFIAQIQDITARKQAEHTVRESEDNYRMLFDSLDEGFCVIEVLCDAHDTPIDYRFLAVNPAFIRQTGIRNAVGQRMRDIAPQHEDQWFAIYGEVAMTGKPRRFEQRAAQLHHYYDVAAFRVGAPEARTVAILFNDITARKHAEAALQQERDSLQVTLTSIGDAVITTDTLAAVTFLNPVAEILTGWSAQEARGRPLSEIFPIINEQTRQPMINPVEKVIREGRTVELANHTALMTRNGDERLIADSGAPIRDTAGHIYGVVLVFRDVTESKRAEAALRQAKEAAEAADRLKSEFVATMSHELRTPLNVILGYTEMLMDGAEGDLPPPQAEILRRIDRNSRVLFELISMVLDLNRLQAGQLPVEVKEVSVAAVLHEMKAELQGFCDQSGLSFTWAVAEGIPLLHTDAGKLKVVMKNLLSNAVKFTKKGSITIAATQEAGGVELRVTDTGIGIPAAAQTLIFEPFRQLDGSDTRSFGGSGLGLHIVKRLLGVLGGRIRVESESGAGSTFRVWLPLEPPADSSPRTPLSPFAQQAV